MLDALQNDVELAGASAVALDSSSRFRHHQWVAVESIQQTRRRSNAPMMTDVAKLAGVSVGAASMALRDHARISVETKLRVRAAAAELGYVRNAAGRMLREQRAGAIAVVVPNTSRHVFGHAYFMHLLTGISEVANRRDNVVMISTNADAEHGVAAYERILRSGQVDGVIIASAALDDPYVERMVESGLPIVLVGENHDLDDVAAVSLRDVEAAASITRHLVEDHGHRRIAHIAGPLGHQTGRDRFAGFVEAMGNQFDEALVRSGTYDEESGALAMSSLIDARLSFSAVFCANDEMAYAAMTVAAAAGLRIPQDVAVVGFDDFGLARVVTPALTTIRVPAQEMGRIAADLLFGVVDGASARHVVVEVDIVLRQSCGCLANQTART